MLGLAQWAARRLSLYAPEQAEGDGAEQESREEDRLPPARPGWPDIDQLSPRQRQIDVIDRTLRREIAQRIPKKEIPPAALLYPVDRGSDCHIGDGLPRPIRHDNMGHSIAAATVPARFKIGRGCRGRHRLSGGGKAAAVARIKPDDECEHRQR